ncbi:PEP-utilizing enzyme [Nocardioides sp. SLBN-35]|uniref:PEP-utilizing enzyme n=1 Tax=Nocardioides sp. SLBN-35 TaxID=2768445 RepID=UPI0011505074|nr:PEP-utilizing enzyme [Nocardioides sp. SLBN-35]TQK69377.1 phosphohistidine swiveling domain-containing protein [Nocardioides sp. SLBN-35]
MRVLITGVATEDGRDVARLLLAAGHEVVGVGQHRYLDPGVVVVADVDAAGSVDVVVHLAGGPLPVAPGTRIVLPVPLGESSAAAAALSSAGAEVVVVEVAPVAGRRTDRAALQTLADLLGSGSAARQVVHHDDLNRALAAVAVDGAPGPFVLAAPGTVSGSEARRLLQVAGVKPAVPGVSARPAAPLAESAVPAGFGYGWTAREAVEDLARGLRGTRITKRGAAVESGRFGLPTYVIPNNLPASDGGSLVAAASSAEYQGEFDTLVDPRLAVLTATNTSEALPGPLTPMSLDLQLGAQRISNEGMGRMLALEGAALEQQTSLVLGVLGHCVYINASVGVNIVENMPGWDEATVRKDVYGNIPEEVVFRPQGGPPMPTGLASRIATFTATSRVIARARKFKEEAEAVHTAAAAESLTAEQVAALSDDQLHTRALLWRDRLAHAWSVASIGVMMTSAADGIHERGKEPEHVAVDVELLESARTMLAVERLADELRGDDHLLKLAGEGDVEALRAASPSFAAALDAQLAVMGHRGPGECELANPSFSDRPAHLVGSAAAAALRPAASRDAAPVMKSRTGKMAAGAILARERARDGVVRYTHALRLAVRERGGRLVAAGRLSAVDDAFYLTLDELFVDPAGLEERVARRRTERVRLQGIRMPDVVVGTWAPEGVHDGVAVGDTIGGIGVSAGTVEGRVRVLRTPDDDIEPDEVLVASVTDVGHTAMFGYAAAVVTDIGGAASHAAIVAREFGIPCVVDTKHASTSLTDGMLVRVDGAAGTVEVLEAARG